MTQRHYIHLAHRALIAVSGDDRKTFLQGLISNDVAKVGPDSAIYGAFLTPQGKFLHEFFMAEQDGVLLLETELTRRADFIKRLGPYKLRSKVSIAPLDNLQVLAAIGDDAPAALDLPARPGATKPLAGGLVLVDPRLAAAGLRAWLPEGAEISLETAGFEAGEPPAWDALRIRLGLPDGSRDMAPDRALLLENGFDELNGVDWKKGCYLGQELTARTKYRGLIRKRLLPVEIRGPAPIPGTPVLLGDSEAGEMRSHAGNVGLALLRLDSLDLLAKDGGELRAGAAQLIPHKPDWAVF